MKKLFTFSIVWTVGVTIGVIAMWRDPEFDQNAPIVRWILSGMPVFGVWFIRYCWRRVKRYQSVQVVHSEGREVYVWTDLDGSIKKDTVDPRIEWDKEDRMESNT